MFYAMEMLVACLFLDESQQPTCPHPGKAASGEGDCVVAVETRNVSTMNGNKVRMNSIP
jgi:hypothetical protein